MLPNLFGHKRCRHEDRLMILDLFFLYHNQFGGGMLLISVVDVAGSVDVDRNRASPDKSVY